MTLCTRVRIPYELLRANRPGPIISPVAAAPPLCRRTCPQSRPYSAKRSALPCSGAERCALRPALWRPLPARFRGGAGPRGGCASCHFPVSWCPAGTTVPGMHCAHGRIGRVRPKFESRSHGAPRVPADWSGGSAARFEGGGGGGGGRRSQALGWF